MTGGRKELVAALSELLGCESYRFDDLARAAGLDPRRDFQEVDLRGVDLRGEDLSNFDLRRAKLEGARVAGAKFNSTVSPAQLASAIPGPQQTVFFVGRPVIDSSASVLSELGPTFALAERCADAIEEAADDRGRRLYLAATRERTPQAERSVPSAAEIEFDLRGSDAALVIADLRNTFDTNVLTSILEGLSNTGTPWFAFIFTQALPRLGQAMRAKLVDLLGRFAPNIMVSVAGAPVESVGELMAALPATMAEEIAPREAIAFLRAASRSGEIQSVKDRRASPPHDQIRLPAYLLASSPAPADEQSLELLDAWSPTFFKYGRARAKGFVLLEQRVLDLDDLAELLNRLPATPVDVGFFAADRSLDRLYIFWADERSGIWPLLDSLRR